MDLWTLFVGGLVIALGATCTAVGRSQEMKQIASNSETKRGIAPGNNWEDLGSFANMIGAFIVAFGALLALSPKFENSIWPDPDKAPILAFIVFFAFLILLLGFLIVTTISRRKVLKNHNK